MKNNVIKFNVNPFTSLENIMKQVHTKAEGKIIDAIHIERNWIFWKEIEIRVSSPKPITITKEVIKEIIKEVPAAAKAKVPKLPVIKQKTNATSQYRGVTKNRNQFEVSIGHNKKRYWVGSFTSELDAARAYNAKAKELKGIDAILNVIEIDQGATV